MRIGIDARPTQGEFTGDATYWRGLIEALSRLDSDQEHIIYLDARMKEPLVSMEKALQARIPRASTGRIWSAWSFPRALRRDAVDLAHVQYTIPPWMPCPAITSIHDVSFKRHPRFFKLKDRLILDAGAKRAATQAARILAISEYTKKEIVELYGVAPEKVEVVYPGVDAQFKPLDRVRARREALSRLGIHCPFILSVGVIQPRKNLPRLLDAFAKIRTDLEPGMKLVITGKYGWREENLLHRIAELGLVDHVILTGYVAYEDLPLLYNAADLFVYPSVYEGFGLPPLEAMACGIPVITGNQSSLPEVVGEAGLMVDPYDPDTFAEAMLRVLGGESLSEDMSRNGLRQASKFSWDRMARQVEAIYRQVISEVCD